MDEAAAGRLLTDRGLGDLLPVRLVARRGGCTVWEAGLFAPYGDVTAEIQIYPLGEDPVTVVDMEEEITALEDSVERALARELRDNEWGILVTCARKDEPLFLRFFEEGIPKERMIAYHPQLDRILGEDLFHQVKGRWIKLCLASVSRAMQIRDLLKDAETAYAAAGDWEGKLERPLPVLYAILRIPGIERARTLLGAPQEYDELAQMQFGIPTPEPVEVRPPLGGEPLAAFARQLFGLLAAEHRAGICFSRDAGSCLRPEFLLPDGSLSDVYFLCKPEPGMALTNTIARDNLNALLVTCELNAGDIELNSQLLAIAFSQYTRQAEISSGVREFMRAAAEDLARGNTDPLRALLKTCFRITSG